jgi:hypothetical protein
MGLNGSECGVPEVPADQLILDQTLKRLRKLRWIGRELEAQAILKALPPINRIGPLYSGPASRPSDRSALCPSEDHRPSIPAGCDAQPRQKADPWDANI